MKSTIVLVVCCLLLPTYLQAATLRVVKELVNIRQLPDLESKIVARVSRGQVLRELQRSGDWYEIETEGVADITGWIYKSLVKQDKEFSEVENNDGSPIVAQMGEVDLSVSELNSFLHLLNQTAARKRADTFESLKSLVREEMVRKRIINEAVSRGFNRLPRIVEVIERAKSQAIADHFLLQQAKSPDEYPSMLEIQTEYEGVKSKYTTPQRVHIAQIFLPLAESADPEEKKAAQSLVIELFRQARLSVPDFLSLAAVSAEQSTIVPISSDLGWLNIGDVAPGMRKFFTEAEAQSVSPPYLSTQGWHIFKLLDRQEEFTLPLTEVRDEIMVDMRRRKMLKNREQYLRDLLEKEPVAIDEEELQKIVNGN